MGLISTRFDGSSTADEVIAGVDLSGLRAVVTGASSGIGAETARVLAVAGAEVTLAVRNLEAGAGVAAEINRTAKGAKRRLKPTITLSFPVASTVARIRSNSSGLRANGFSTKTALPASRARQVKSACALCRVTMNTASIEGSSRRAFVSVSAA